MIQCFLRCFVFMKNNLSCFIYCPFLDSDRAIIKRASVANRKKGIDKNGLCGIHLAKEDIRQDIFAFIVSKNSLYEKQISRL